jgi:hypothetical protein
MIPHSWPGWFGSITGVIAAAGLLYVSADDGWPVVVSVPLALGLGVVVGGFWYWMEHRWAFLDLLSNPVRWWADRALTAEEREAQLRANDDDGMDEPRSPNWSWFEVIGLLVGGAIFLIAIGGRVIRIIEKIFG